MKRFYENMLQKKFEKALALNDAQKWVRDMTMAELVDNLGNYTIGILTLEEINDYKRRARLTPEKKVFAHPHYWGAFTCNGNWK